MSLKPTTSGGDSPVPPSFTFTSDPSVSAFAVPLRTYLAQHEEYDAIAAGALVFDAAGRVLLIQRAAHDSMPNCWEVPGGACDLDDETLLHGLARELWEESGLVAQRVGRQVPCGKDRKTGEVREGAVFFTRNGRRVCKFTFEVEVEEGGQVKLDADEHQGFLWAAEEEIRAGKVGEMEIKITTSQQVETILDGFRMRSGADRQDIVAETKV